MRVTLFDYGAGNLHSLAKAIAVHGADVRVETDLGRALTTDVLVLPGVGAFGPAAARMAEGRAALSAALDAGLACLGVCLGMQLLFDASDEGGGAGAGFFPGRVTRLDSTRTPHIGWNTLDVAPPAGTLGPLVAAPLWVYYAHSFACRATRPSDVVAWSTVDGDRFPAAVRRGRVLGVQFHPEKSSAAGVALIGAFLREVAP